MAALASAMTPALTLVGHLLRTGGGSHGGALLVPIAYVAAVSARAVTPPVLAGDGALQPVAGGMWLPPADDARQVALLTPLADVLPALPALAADAAVAATSAAAAAAAVAAAAAARRAGVLSGGAARKAVHFGTAPAYVATWAAYSEHPAARVVAAALPVGFGLALFLAARGGSGGGTASGEDADGRGSGDGGGDGGPAVRTGTAPPHVLASAVSRSGAATEAGGGPLAYVAVLTAATLLGWRSSPVAAVALGMLVGGDGAAEVVGRRWGRGTEWSRLNGGMGGAAVGGGKTVVGSVAFVLGGGAASVGVLAELGLAGTVLGGGLGGVARLLGIGAACAAAELWGGVDDNVSVPVVAAVLAAVLL
ncbi:hypothetical protein MMPV_004840 [Pyropia vietnamensis]